VTFTETELKGAFLVDLQRKEDARGFFARTFCVREFQAHGLNPALVQCNTAFTFKAGTLRGMHFQVGPHEEDKLVRCTSGVIHDVIIDLRPGSPTFRRPFAVELSAKNRRMLYVPKGFAHGFQTLQDNTEVFYQMSEYFVPECAQGVRWNDPAFGIAWPLANPILNERDRTYPDFV
jgi:dTDP-4-dehydrorhamnose 3,5-epimerase